MWIAELDRTVKGCDAILKEHPEYTQLAEGNDHIRGKMAQLKAIRKDRHPEKRLQERIDEIDVQIVKAYEINHKAQAEFTEDNLRIRAVTSAACNSLEEERNRILVALRRDVKETHEFLFGHAVRILNEGVKE